MRIERTKGRDWKDDIGYRQAVRVGPMLTISGVAASGEMPDATRSVYNELEKILKAHGLTFKNAVKENAYTTNLDGLKANPPLRRTYYGKGFPAATWVQIPRSYDADHVLEVELIAVFPE